jgi:pSer/pThr/pTyr-binding forkhead associated (FHA) protein
VSEFQCVIFVSVREGKVFVRDQEDTTGTFLNDRRVTTSLQEARHGDRLQLGPFVFEFCIEQTSANAGASRMNLVPPGWATAESDSEQELTYSDDRYHSSWLGSAHSADWRAEPLDRAFTVEELDLDAFKSGLGAAPPAKFNGEGVLRERWADAYQLELEQRLRDSQIESRAGPIIARGLWEAERRRRRRAAVYAAALMLLAYAAAAFWWSRTDWQRQLESQPPHTPIKSMVLPLPWMEGQNGLSQNQMNGVNPTYPWLNGDNTSGIRPVQRVRRPKPPRNGVNRSPDIARQPGTQSGRSF